MSEKKIWFQNEVTCKPLDSIEEIASFLQNPPAWRTLCEELIPHSDSVVKNIDVNPFFGQNLLETPQTFCHYDPETEEVEREQKCNVPKTLICHDMANGYHDDSYIDGTGNYSAYTFYNWAAIDIFCYFSHHFITIPPLGWINVAHAHGVKVIGTVITEWAEGVALWDGLLASEDKWREFASMLVAIAKTLKFDGWLLNIENKISKPDVLLQFVSELHRALHAELRGAVLLWYDSVTIHGHLNWQNALNDNNRAFFDATDGLFTNYSWRVSDVSSSADEAGGRRHDLFVGIDVWGRNFHGGGQFNTQEVGLRRLDEDYAVKVAFGYGCSLAIFAPAWTHEAMTDDVNDVNWVTDAEDLDSYERFLLRDRALWNSLWPLLNTKLPSRLPFQTSFCRGQGKKRRIYGEVIGPVPWYNLRHMQYQPNSSLGPHGYLLSTKDNIKHLSTMGLLKNKDGVIRYRRSLEASRMELAAGKSKDLSMTIEADSLTALEQDGNVESPKEPNEVRPSMKRTMKNALRNFFRMKASKIEVVKEKGEEENNDEKSEKYDSSGKSMVQMSVNLRLGRKTNKTRYGLGYIPTELECLEPFYEDCFVGGSCLKVNPSDESSPEHRLSRLFFCDFFCESSIIVCVVTKTLPGHENQYLNIRLNVTEEDGRRRKVILVGRNIPHGLPEPSGTETVNLYPVNDDVEFAELQKYMVLNEPEFYVPVRNAYGWRVRYYVVALPGAIVTSLSCRGGLPHGPVLLGRLGLCLGPGDQIQNFNDIS